MVKKFEEHIKTNEVFEGILGGLKEAVEFSTGKLNKKIKLEFYFNRGIFEIKNLLKKGIKLFISIEAIADYYHIANQEIDEKFLKFKLVNDKEFLDKIYSSVRFINSVAKKDKELLITSDILND
jgi:hypothetical protein